MNPSQNPAPTLVQRYRCCCWELAVERRLVPPLEPEPELEHRILERFLLRSAQGHCPCPALSPARRLDPNLSRGLGPCRNQENQSLGLGPKRVWQ